MLPHSACASSWALRGRSAISRWSLSARRRCMRKRSSIRPRWSVTGSPWPGRTRSTSIARVLRQRVEVAHERLRPVARAVERAGDQRVRRDVPEQVVGGDQRPPLGVLEDGVGRRVAGPPVDLPGAVAERQLLAVVQHARRPSPTRPRRGRRARPTAAPARRPRGCRGGASSSPANSSLACISSAKLSTIGTRAVDRRDLGAGARGDQPDQAEVVDVLWVTITSSMSLERLAERLEPRWSARRARCPSSGPVSTSVSGSSSTR